ncbi:MAG: aldehyde dehydrogenase family protein, partial [Firmicutes bacterium]|nr:aldehyde dehydrogenase family protein [Bacillota bacterium]
MAIAGYQPTALIDFSLKDSQEKMEAALAAVKAQWGQNYPLIIGQEHRFTDSTRASFNPAHPQDLIGSVAVADASAIDDALQAGWTAFETWRKEPADHRARYLFKAAAIMRRRRLELAAWEVYEAGKSWAEADGDVAEAIDFLEYYGRQMIRLSAPVPLSSLEGEEDEAFYIPLGVGAVIPPWNFPLAILAGMSSGAIVAGNPILLKPSSVTPIIGAQFAAIMEEAGLPPGVLNFVPGPGAEIGDYIVSHPQIRFISFTGSKEVGLRITHLASQKAPGQHWIKRVVTEMGGKDAIVVDETADLDAAADGIVVSAFGFQGQKCSACSRAIVVESVYDALVNKIDERTQKLAVGDPAHPSTFMGPVIDENAVAK